MRRIRCTAPGLAELSYLPGQDVMLTVPTPAGPTFRRRYTIRSFDPAVPAIDIDMVLHGDGPAAAWATSAQPGSHIEGIGPRGKITVDPDADWHLFAGDDSALPASLAMAASVLEAEGSDSGRAIVVLEVDGPDDEQRDETSDGQEVPVRWLHRAGGDPASGATGRRPGRPAAPVRGRSCLSGRRIGRGGRHAAGASCPRHGGRSDLGQALLAGRKSQCRPR